MRHRHRLASVGLPTAAWVILAALTAVVLAGQVGRDDASDLGPRPAAPAASAVPAGTTSAGLLP